MTHSEELIFASLRTFANCFLFGLLSGWAGMVTLYEILKILNVPHTVTFWRKFRCFSIFTAFFFALKFASSLAWWD